MRIAIGFLFLALLAFACYPHGPTPCAPNDTSCLPCNDPASTNPTCIPFPSDTRRPDGGADH
jgi:hypothetical protein